VQPIRRAIRFGPRSSGDESANLGATWRIMKSIGLNGDGVFPVWDHIISERWHEQLALPARFKSKIRADVCFAGRCRDDGPI
jgi:hypothetical protein